MLNAYGATETTSPTTMMPAGLTRAHADSVGVALPARRHPGVMDDDGREVAPGDTGELWIGGPMVVPLLGQPEATAAAFTAGYWHSGDLGSVDAQGFVRVFDRKKDMLNRGGFKIYSVEVENVLMAWPGMVGGRGGRQALPGAGRAGARGAACAGRGADDAALRRFCAERLADYKVPDQVLLERPGAAAQLPTAS